MVKSTPWLAGLAWLTQYWTSIPATSKCSNPRTRASWTTLTAQQKGAYITAVQCLMKAPSKAKDLFPNAVSRYDDFVATHIYYTTAPDPNAAVDYHGITGPGIHYNGVFLPWHRYFLWAYESALISECNYKGTQPYWDWTADNPEYGSSFEKAAVFSIDPAVGFGGNGAQGSFAVPANASQQAVAPGSCITGGAFAADQVNLGYGYSVASNPHCIERNIQIDLANESLGWTKNILPLVAHSDYWSMAQEWDTSSVGAPAGPHGAGHKGVGGDMWNIWSSPNDPLFFMHHAQIDHIFWYWQTQKASNKNLIGGPIYTNGTGTVTANYVLQMTPFIAPSIQIGSVLDTINQNGQGVLCYTYEDSGTAGYRRMSKFKRMFNKMW